MPSLPDELFSLLENKTLQARETAEKAARNIIAYFKVESGAWWGDKDDRQRNLWLGLRARARQLGYAVEDDVEKDPVKRGLPQLVEEIAYEQWHRMLFARFLAENDLLMHPSGVAVSLAECEELAKEEGEDDAWRLAARYASTMLPGIFKLEDPCAQVRLTPSDHHALESILLAIPILVFRCDDALGWMYQFWQGKKKEEVNASERKIGGADLSPVTQLFTEDYMVRFLLENSLGAWWAARHPDSPLIKEWRYLRFKEDNTPAAGTFPGWPEHASDVTVLDPCCGSGHFLVVAFEMLCKMRMDEEGLNFTQASDAVFYKNLFGLELDPRCTQIAVFALALASWKGGGFRPLPALNVACAGIPVQGQLETWLKLAGKDTRVHSGLQRLFGLFKNAPDLGSLINPADLPAADRMFVADYELVAPVLEKALVLERNSDDPVVNVFGAAAEGVAKAARLLAGKYTLVTTNVPYLLRRKQGEILQDFLALNHPHAKTDLATAFVERCISFCDPNGSTAIVTPQNWLFLQTYKQLRQELLKKNLWNVVAKLGTGAFTTISGEVVNIALLILTIPSIQNEKSYTSNKFLGIDVMSFQSAREKDAALVNSELLFLSQDVQMHNPDHRVILTTTSQIDLLENYAFSFQGIVSGDSPRFVRFFWEIPAVTSSWKHLQSTVEATIPYGGREHIIFWEDHKNNLARLQGLSAVGKKGISVTQMQSLASTLYSGDYFDINAAALIPKKPEYLPAIWAFCSSPEFNKAVRQIDQALKVTNATLVKVPFDLNRWQKVAQEIGVLPEPYSEDPTQWLFDGHPKDSMMPIQVALSRLLDYRWPQQFSDSLDVMSDNDGIACLPAVNGEPPAVERLRALMAAAYGREWSGAKQQELLAAVNYSGNELRDWLSESFFEQHCRLFYNRPFIWHIWDGRKDGFSALVNYHKLDRSNLEKITYTYLGAWIIDRKKDLEKGVSGAEGRLLAAQLLQDKLKLILVGEPPYDLYVRWKPLHEQPIGWEPDLNDGVRLNIRPFVTAGVLRSRFTINWNKDRGKNPDGSERLNDLHFSNDQKRAARLRAGIK